MDSIIGNDIHDSVVCLQITTPG